MFKKTPYSFVSQRQLAFKTTKIGQKGNITLQGFELRIFATGEHNCVSQPRKQLLSVAYTIVITCRVIKPDSGFIKHEAGYGFYVILDLKTDIEKTKNTFFKPLATLRCQCVMNTFFAYVNTLSFFLASYDAIALSSLQWKYSPCLVRFQSVCSPIQLEFEILLISRNSPIQYDFKILPYTFR